jgi:hypothetical protein
MRELKNKRKNMPTHGNRNSVFLYIASCFKDNGSAAMNLIFFAFCSSMPVALAPSHSMPRITNAMISSIPPRIEFAKAKKKMNAIMTI